MIISNLGRLIVMIFEFYFNHLPDEAIFFIIRTTKVVLIQE